MLNKNKGVMQIMPKPKVMIESPALRAIKRRKNKIHAVPNTVYKPTSRQKYGMLSFINSRKDNFSAPCSTFKAPSVVADCARTLTNMIGRINMDISTMDTTNTQGSYASRFHGSGRNIAKAGLTKTKKGMKKKKTTGRAAFETARAPYDSSRSSTFGQVPPQSRSSL
jgi:hypothetical protein